MPMGRRQFAKRPPRHSGHDRRTTHQCEAVLSRGKTEASTAWRRDAMTGLEIPRYQRPGRPPRPARPRHASAGARRKLRTQTGGRDTLARGHQTKSSGSRLLKSQSHSGAFDEGVNPGALTGLTRLNTAQQVSRAGRGAAHKPAWATAFLHKPIVPGARPPGTHGGSPT